VTAFIIWSIGATFTLGYVQSDEDMTFLETLLIIVFWPFGLGVALRKYVDEWRHKP
jgi:hypothetical protein